MSIIQHVIARQIFDSRGNPTIEVEVYTQSGIMGRAAIPSGASTGEHEAVELRDGGKEYMGKGVHTAVQNVNTTIAEQLVGFSVTEQQTIDEMLIELDGTPDKSRLGANAILGVSLAVAQAAAKYSGLPLYKYIGGVYAHTLPVPMMNIINGGSHSDAPIAFQEFMIMPVGANNFTAALKMGTEIFHHLKSILKKRGLSTAVGDEGGYAPAMKGTEDALETILEAVKTAGYKPGDDVVLALDVAASEFYKDGKYDYRIFEGDQAQIRSTEAQVDYLNELIEKYPIISIEDGMSEDDWKGWEMLQSRIGNRVMVVGDDLYVTNVQRLREGIKRKASNAILIKVNQIGTLTETLAAVETAHRAGFRSIISHRSGETEDTFIADLSVALNTGYIKTGSASRTDRMAKYNQLLRIEEELGDNARYGKL